MICVLNNLSFFERFDLTVYFKWRNDNESIHARKPSLEVALATFKI